MNKVIAIVGPTGSGKTALALDLAQIINGEIINADSIQIYKKIDIASAKASQDDRKRVKHHLLDIKEVDEEYTVYDYQMDARKVIEEIIRKGKTPILVGGTGLYIKAALYDYQFVEENENYDYSLQDTSILYKELLKIDAKTIIHPNNRKRIERALTNYKNCGKIDKQKTNKLLYDVIFIGLTFDRQSLYERLNKRVDQMLEMGLIEEAKYMYRYYKNAKAVLNAISYKDLFSYFEGNITKEEAISKIKQRTRNYAKRQYTFFNNQMDVKWFDMQNCTIKDICDYTRIKNLKK